MDSLTETLITLDHKEAAARAREYRTELKRLRTAPTVTDAATIRTYRALANPKVLGVVSLAATMKAAGVDDQGFPRLAIANAARTARPTYFTHRLDGAALFTFEEYRYPRSQRMTDAYRDWFRLPAGTYPTRREGLPASAGTGWFETITPQVPPRYRVPRMDRLAILWEPEGWRPTSPPPGDPALLRYMGGDLWAVLAVWDLTNVERLALGMVR